LFSRDLDFDFKFISKEKFNQIQEFNPNITHSVNEEAVESMQDVDHNDSTGKHYE
jgi:hypothetical protein